MSGCGCELEAKNAQERKTLAIVLGLNGAMFLVELCLGLVADSTGLLADSLDMLADASVYGISLYALGKGEALKHRAARFSGIFQATLAFWVIFGVIQRFRLGSEPLSILMMGVGGLALIVNIVCLVLISNHQDAGVHMRSSMIFSTNDVIANLGVILSGVLVSTINSRYPDLVIGAIIAALVLRGSVHILQDVATERSKTSQDA